MLEDKYGNILWEPIMAHPRHRRGESCTRTSESGCWAPKGGAAKLKAYVVAAQRASAGEAHGARLFFAP